MGMFVQQKIQYYYTATGMCIKIMPSDIVNLLLKEGGNHERLRGRRERERGMCIRIMQCEFLCKDTQRGREGGDHERVREREVKKEKKRERERVTKLTRKLLSFTTTAANTVALC